MPSKIVKSDAEWRARLTPLQYNVARRRGTERAFSWEYCTLRAPGVYACVCCGSRLFVPIDGLLTTKVGGTSPGARKPIRYWSSGE